MTWKAYAAVSGATVLAGWFASAPPSGFPDSGVPGSSAAVSNQAVPNEIVSNQTTPQRAAPVPDIEREATRLEARARREAAYVQPQRNPFRFGAARPTVSLAVDAAETSSSDETFVPAGVSAVVSTVPLPPQLSLAGIAEDQIGQRVERTAILSSPAGVLLVHEGEDVLGEYRVAKIESEAVELLSHADGTTLRLGFGVRP